MKNLVLMLLCGLLMVSCEQKLNPDMAMNEIKAQSAVFAEGFNTMNVEKIMSTYWNSPDIVVWYPDANLKGYDAVKEYWQKTFEQVDVKKFELIDHKLAVHGNAVHETAMWSYAFQPKGGPEITSGGRADVLWEKKNGKWLITFDHASILFVPPAPPAQ